MSRLVRSLTTIFKPPFEGLGISVVLYFAFAHLIYPHNDVLRGNLPDPDNYMYLTQVLDWLNGQSWYDNIQSRMNPPQGVLIHFSRFTQIPLAAGILFFKGLGLPSREAALTTALIEPLALLCLCLSTLRRTVRSVVPEQWAGASAYISLFSVALLYEFMPGQVGHHGLVIVLTIIAIGYILRLIDEPHDLRAGAVAGLTLAFTMMIALECLPWVLLLSAWLGAWSIKRGGKASRSCSIYAASLLVGTIVCLAVTRPLAQFLASDILTFSFVYGLLATAIALPFVGVAAWHEATKRWLPSLVGMTGRVVVGLILAIFCGGLFLCRFPEMATGPYGAIDPQLVPILLNTVENAKPILQTEDGVAHFFNLSLGLLALIAALTFAWRGRGALREKWGLLALLQAAAIGLTVFYQYRFLSMEEALAIIPLTRLLQCCWQRIELSLRGRERVIAQIGLLLLLGPLPVVLIPSLFDSRSFTTGVLLFPVEPGNTPCDMGRLERILRNPFELGDKHHLILTRMDLGPELLFRTDHSVLAAPYHTNVQGNLDAFRFFTSSSADEARNIAQRRNADLMVLCRAVPTIYLAPKGASPTFTDAVLTKPAPGWLARFPSQVLDNFALYQILPETYRSDAIESQGKK